MSCGFYEKKVFIEKIHQTVFFVEFLFYLLGAYPKFV